MPPPRPPPPEEFPDDATEGGNYPPDDPANWLPTIPHESRRLNWEGRGQHDSRHQDLSSFIHRLDRDYDRRLQRSTTRDIPACLNIMILNAGPSRRTGGPKIAWLPTADVILGQEYCKEVEAALENNYQIIRPTNTSQGTYIALNKNTVEGKLLDELYCTEERKKGNTDPWIVDATFATVNFRHQGQKAPLAPQVRLASFHFAHQYVKEKPERNRGVYHITTFLHRCDKRRITFAGGDMNQASSLRREQGHTDTALNQAINWATTERLLRETNPVSVTVAHPYEEEQPTCLGYLIFRNPTSYLFAFRQCHRPEPWVPLCR